MTIDSRHFLDVSCLLAGLSVVAVLVLVLVLVASHPFIHYLAIITFNWRIPGPSGSYGLPFQGTPTSMMHPCMQRDR